jgi:drug/metabolite transporter (DMT)-like permease
VVFVMGVVILVWGAAFSGIKVMLEHLSPAGLTASRLLVSALTLTVILPFAGDGKVERKAGDLTRLVVLGLCGSAGYQLAINWGEQFISAGVASLIVATMPVMVVILAALVLSEALGRRGLTGVLIAFAGVALLVLASEGGLEARNITGVGVTLLAPASWAVYTIVSKPLSARYDGVRLNLVGAWLGALIVLPLGLGDLGALARMDAGAWLWLLYLGVFSSALSYIAYVWALRRWTASGVASFVYLVPVSSLAWAWVLLGEVPGVLALAGGALIIGGVVLVQRR